jgi:hypothetical protein
MKRHLSLLILIFTSSLFAAHEPIDDFGWSQYLGNGYLSGFDDMEGSYSAYLQTEGNVFKEAIVFEHDAYYFKTTFNFTEKGRFGLVLEKHINTKDEKGKIKENVLIYNGHGYCGTMQCHLFAETEDGYFEETITIDDDNDSIYKLGSEHRRDADGKYQIATWEAYLVNIDHDDKR